MDNLLAALEAPVPSPAGGSAAAAVGAIAASLVVMVGRGSPAWPDGPSVAAAAAERRDRLTALGDDDVDAVAGVISAFSARLPPEEIDAARLDAARVPLEIAEQAAEVALLAREAAQRGKPVMQADAAAAASLADAAAHVAASIVDLNLSSFAPGDGPGDVPALRARALAVAARLTA